MKNLRRLIGIVLAGLIFVGWTVRSAPADEPTATKTGSVNGTVVKDGKPVANARVGLMVAPVKTRVKGLGKHPATQPADDQTTKKRGRHNTLANTSTDADGKFTLENIAPGEYVVIAGEKGQGRGKARLTVTSGESASVSIDLQAPKDKIKKPNKLGL